MKYNTLHRILVVSGLLLISLGNASAQFSVNGGAARYNSVGSRDYNPFRIPFAQAWDLKLQDPVKLIEIAPVLNDQTTNLLMMVDGNQRTDYRRKLLVTHWDGLHFVTDTSIDFFGTVLDSLLAGRFHTMPKPAPVPTTAADKKVRKPQSPPTRQIVTTEGVWYWTGGTLRRLYSAPANLKLAVVQDGTQDQLVSKIGDTIKVYEADETEVNESEYQWTGTEDGYPHYGVGTQNYEGVKDLLPGVRYAQTYWSIRYRWQVGLLRGKSANLRDLPDATLGDKVVVYVPKAANKDRTFWQLPRTDQYEEAWRSPALPGRVLDVRVGDPKHEGKVGILVLTSENEDRDRHLYFFAPVEGTNR